MRERNLEISYLEGNNRIKKLSSSKLSTETEINFVRKPNNLKVSFSQYYI